MPSTPTGTTLGSRTPFLLAVVLVSAVLLGASGESEPAGPVAVEVSMTDEFVFEPDTLELGRGAELTLTASNVSTQNREHDLVVLDGVFENLGDINRAIDENSNVVLGDTGIVGPGESGTVVVTWDEPGEYQLSAVSRGISQRE